MRIALLGLPNVGKTTFINTITGSNLKTGNYFGTTVQTNDVTIKTEYGILTFIDTPGIYSIKNQQNPSEDVKISLSFILNQNKYDAIIFIKSNTNQDEQLKQESIDLAKQLNKKIIIVKNLQYYNKKQAQDVVKSLFENKQEIIFDKSQQNKISKITNLIESISTHSIFGIPFFFFTIFVLFLISFNIGSIASDLIESVFQKINSLFTNQIIKATISSFGALLSFIPTILTTFFCLSFLENSGYITRICYIFGGIAKRFGLDGKAFINIMIGTSCTVYAYMSTRIISNKKARFLTMIATSFVPCSAKIAVFSLFCKSLFTPLIATIALFLIYIFGIFFGLLTALVISKLTQKEQVETFFQMPQLTKPNFKKMFSSTLQKLISYLKNTGPTIAIFSFIFSTLSSITFSLKNASNIQESILGKIAQIAIPIFKPIGIETELLISLLAGLAGKEIAISTIAVLLSAENETSIATTIATKYTQASCISFLIFMFFYAPCASAMATFYKENQNSKLKTLFLFVLTTFLAYSCSYIYFSLA